MTFIPCYELAWCSPFSVCVLSETLPSTSKNIITSISFPWFFLSQVQRLPRNAASASSQKVKIEFHFALYILIYIFSWHLNFLMKRFQGSTGISGVAEVASSLGISNGINTSEETSNGTRWFKPAFLMRSRSAINSVVQQTSSSKQQSWWYFPMKIILLLCCN